MSHSLCVTDDQGLEKQQRIWNGCSISCVYVLIVVHTDLIKDVLE